MGDDIFAEIDRIKTIETTSFDFLTRLSDLHIAVSLMTTVNGP